MATTDRHGHPVSGADGAAVERYEAALEALLLFEDGVAEAWDATVADHAGFALGHVGRAYIRCLSSEGPDAVEAALILDGIGDGPDLTDRERRHLAAARAYTAGDLHGAAAVLDDLSVAYPLDALALVVGHQLDFFRGDAAGLRDRLGRALLSWGPGDPHYGFLLGMHAFGLEECNLHPQAEAAGMAALDRQPRDVWAVHAVVHVHEMQGRFAAGLRFLDERRPHWTEGNFLVVHNSWHEALFRLEAGDTAGALAVYDAVLHNAESPGVALEMLDAAALLWRLHLDGADAGGRWAPLADAWAAKDPAPWYVFNDVHAVMSFVGAGRLDEARSVLDRLGAYVAAAPPGAPVANVAMTAEVGLPVCAALLAFGEGRFVDVIRLLHPIRGIVHRYGGSIAQRDAVARTLLEAAILSGEHGLARAVVSERLAVREASPYGWRQLARLRRAAADEAGALAAETRVAELRATA